MDAQQLATFIAEHGADLPECCDDACGTFAMHDVHWPGQETQMCARHLKAAGLIAEALGFKLHFTAIPATAKFLELLCIEFTNAITARFQQIELD